MNSVYIEITDVCNLHCSFCPCGIQYVEKHNTQCSHHKQITRTFMPPELFEKCITGATEIGAQNVFFHVLGEPTLHPSFAHYIKKLENTPLKLTLTTNGTTIARTSQTILQSKAIRQINFSTHAYAELPKDEAVEYLQNVLDFCKIACVIQPDLYINLRLWNIGATESTPWNNYMLSRINETFESNIVPQNFCSRHKSFKVKGRLYLHEDTRFEWPELNENKNNYKKNFLRGTCKALDTHIAILHDGRVVACCLDYSGQILLGNIQNQHLSEIIKSPFAINLKEGFEKHELRHTFCQSCNYCKRFK